MIAAADDIIERDGRVVFAVKYLWWLCRYGYCNNPYEVEARAAESHSIDLSKMRQ